MKFDINEIISLLEEKNKYYGDSYKELGYLGMAYRIKDKSNRIINMILNQEKIGTTEEDIIEEVKDILGYSILMMKNKGGRWK